MANTSGLHDGKQHALLASLMSVLFLASSLMASAQTAASQPQVVMTWQATTSYVPAGYPDKALPAQASGITASLGIVANGKEANLSNQTIYWYLDDTLIGGGAGATYISFSPFGAAPNFMTLKAELPDYDGNLIVHAVQIPLIEPKAVIEANHPTAQVSGNSTALKAMPYFFPITDPSSLSYAWSVNGTSPTTALNPQILNLNIDPNTPSGSTFAVTLTITDPNTQVAASDSTNLTYVKEL